MRNDSVLSGEPPDPQHARVSYRERSGLLACMWSVPHSILHIQSMHYIEDDRQATRSSSSFPKGFDRGAVYRLVFHFPCALSRLADRFWRLLLEFRSIAR